LPIAASRCPWRPGVPAKLDYEYVHKGATNLFVALEPEAGKRVVSVTDHRGKTDSVGFVQALLTHTYATARRVHLVLDDLNIHFRKCFDDVYLILSYLARLHTDCGWGNPPHVARRTEVRNPRYRIRAFLRLSSDHV